MPHSPYRKTIHPPIDDMDEYIKDLNRYRVGWENEQIEVKYLPEMLLSIAEPAIEHCKFLETKLEIKVRIDDVMAQHSKVNWMASLPKRGCARCRNATTINLPTRTTP